MKTKNRKASYDYQLLKRFETGIELLGAEVKAIRAGKANIDQAYARIINGQVYLVNAKIPVKDKKNYSEDRSRRLLLHKSEIIAINTELKAKKLTLVPTKLYTKGRLIKAEIAIAKSKRKYSKKETLKARAVKRDIERELRGRT